MLFDKVYLINLARRPERLARTRERLDAAKVKSPLQVVDAIDGRFVTRSYLDESGVRLLEPYRDPLFGQYHLSGRVAQALSHVTAWSEISNDASVERALIIEDDAVFGDDFHNRCVWLERELVGLEWDFVYLGRRKLSPLAETKAGENLVIPRFSAWTTAYVLTRGGADKLLATDYLRKLVPIDEFLPWMCGDGGPYMAGVFEPTPVLKAVALPSGVNLVTPEEETSSSSDTQCSEPIELSPGPVKVQGETGFLLIAYADERTDGLARLEHSAMRYGVPVEIAWAEEGVTRSESILRCLEAHDDLQDLVVLLVDPDNTVVNIHPFRIFESFRESRSNVLCLGEKLFWENAAMEPRPDRSYGARFGWDASGANPSSRALLLGASCVIGYADVLAFLLKRGVDGGLGFADTLLASYMSGEGLVKIDYYIDLFQSLFKSEADVRVDFRSGMLVNVAAWRLPGVVNADGPLETRFFLHKICNYICGNWKQGYGSCAIGTLVPDPGKRVFLAIASLREEQGIGETLEAIERLSYPKDRMVVRFYNQAPSTAPHIKRWLSEAASSYAEASLVDLSGAPEDPRERIFADAEGSGCDYLFSLDADVVLSEESVVERLMEDGRGIVAPLLKKRSQSNWSNFWGDVSPLGLYVPAVDYMDIVSGQRRGCWNVFYVAGAYLVDARLLPVLRSLRLGNAGRPSEMVLCEQLRANGIFMFLDNRLDFGYKLEPKKSALAAAI